MAETCAIRLRGHVCVICDAADRRRAAASLDAIIRDFEAAIVNLETLTYRSRSAIPNVEQQRLDRIYGEWSAQAKRLRAIRARSLRWKENT
jgi:hypothetical protein